ncbi:MAG TPA: nucleotide exchange factor GrpE [Candidatus Hydrogenedentes bacterium]|jgi:molecular chaperone GrpE|nr:nucleotide exchange factor GrpE [Candidatus Hydrogenedentota bacterium]HPJ99423.1 nucleotide exchange factor GrpE [Candidatus Hydrogenedentota bacterium]
MKKKNTKKSFLEEQLEAEARKQAGASDPGDPAADTPGAEAHSEGLPGDGTRSTGGAAAAEPVDVEALLEERDQLKDQLLRARAEFDNFRKRNARDYERLRKTAAEALVRDLLPVMDHLELALKHADDASNAVVEGVQMVARQFADVLGRHGVVPIPALGEAFDPNVHEAMMQRADDDAEPNTVLEEFQRGYCMGDLVLRPSKVVVSSAPSAASADSSDGGSEEG